MICVKFKNVAGFVDWSLGEKIHISPKDILKVEYIEVDGNELSWLVNSFVNIPYHRTREPQVWFGDMARFIVAQIPAKGVEL